MRKTYLFLQVYLNVFLNCENSFVLLRTKRQERCNGNRRVYINFRKHIFALPPPFLSYIFPQMKLIIGVGTAAQALGIE